MRSWIPAFVKNWVRKRRTRKRIDALSRMPPWSLHEFREFLISSLGIQSGDTLFIHASFSDLKLEGTVEEAVETLIHLVGSQGNILMPFYPLKSSHEFLLEGKPFDLRKNRTSMGALVTAFVKKEGVKKSIHPTKSVAVYGKDRDFLVADHHKSSMPYGELSPYCRIKDLSQSRIMGLGVPSDFLSCMHVGVDLSPNYPIQPYHPLAIEGMVISPEGAEVRVVTYAHDLAITNREDVPRFLNETRCPTYREVEYKGRTFFVVEAKELIRHTIEQGQKGNTFFYPKSLNHHQPKREPL